MVQTFVGHRLTTSTTEPNLSAVCVDNTEFLNLIRGHFQFNSLQCLRFRVNYDFPNFKLVLRYCIYQYSKAFKL